MPKVTNSHRKPRRSVIALAKYHCPHCHGLGEIPVMKNGTAKPVYRPCRCVYMALGRVIVAIMRMTVPNLFYVESRLDLWLFLRRHMPHESFDTLQRLIEYRYPAWKGGPKASRTHYRPIYRALYRAGEVLYRRLRLLERLMYY